MRIPLPLLRTCIICISAINCFVFGRHVHSHSSSQVLITCFLSHSFQCLHYSITAGIHLLPTYETNATECTFVACKSHSALRVVYMVTCTMCAHVLVDPPLFPTSNVYDLSRGNLVVPTCCRHYICIVHIHVSRSIAS